MSTALRIAAVTEALQTLLLPVVQAVTADAQIRVGRPQAEDGGVLWQGLNVYLFHVARNTDAGALDLATRDPRGTLIQRPQMAVDLHYLFSFFGEAEKQVPEQMLGGVLAALHAEPTLTGAMLDALVAHDPSGFVARSDLSAQTDRVSFEILKMSLEDLTRVWGMFQLPYTLTVPIVASMVRLEAELTPHPAPPVRLVHLSVSTGPAPTLLDGPLTVAEMGDVVALPARGLESTGAALELGGGRFPVDRVQPGEVRLRLRAEHLGGVRPGPVPLTLRTADGVLVGTSTVTVRPQIQGVEALRIRQSGVSRPVGRSGPVLLHLDVMPPVGGDQSVTVSITPVADPTKRIGGQPSVATAPAPESVEVDPAGTVQARFPPLAAGVYRVALSVDGVDGQPAPAQVRALSRDMVRVR